MKRIFLIILCFCLMLCGCDNEKTVYFEPKQTDETVKAVWFSYYDYDFCGLCYEDFCKKIDLWYDNVKSLGLNTVIMHTRPNADALYESQLFPWSDCIGAVQGENPGYDPLKYMVESAKTRNLKIFAWINPFRISASDSTDLLCENNIAKIWQNSEDKSTYIKTVDGKMYFEPSSDDVRRLIVDGVEEIAKNYDVDAILFDDYFYPTTDESFDLSEYGLYSDNTEYPLTLTQWRAANISLLLGECYRAAHKYGKSFGISPRAETGEDSLLKNGYVDINRILSNTGYADFLMPQIYWGFEYPNENYRFDNVLENWKALSDNLHTKIYPCLAFYKCGTEDKNSEWQDNDNIISRQVELAEDSGFDGFGLYSYSYVFSESEQNAAERENLKEKLRN